MDKILLTIDLVPQTVWYKNLRSMLSKEEWDIIRRWAYKKADYKCEICGGKGDKWPVEAHEVWEYDNRNKIQKLIDVRALCPMCHKVKHIGLAQLKGEYDIALQHLAKVNNWTLDEAQKYIDRQVETWRERNMYEWETDISFARNLLANIGGL